MRICIPENKYTNISAGVNYERNKQLITEQLKSFIDSIQPSLSAGLKRRTGEHYKSYVHRLFRSRQTLNKKVQNRIITYEGYLVLENAHTERIKRLQKRFPHISLKKIEKILN